MWLRSLFLAHRYLGAMLGLLMLVWCLSGIVMMYVPYPTLGQALRLPGLTPIDWGACCTFPSGDFPSRRIADMQLEMLGLDPVLRLLPDSPAAPPIAIDLRDGHEFTDITLPQAHAAASGLGRALGYLGTPAFEGSVTRDQWTVGSYRKDAPLFEFTWPDPRRPVVYISSRTGIAVQLTTAGQRFWNWLGAIPHWLYFTSLRERPQLWAGIVVAAASVGSLLTVIGLYLGLLQYRRSRQRLSPYRGFLFWHHVPGLIFGVFTLAWVSSGLVSMNPGGFLDEDGPGREQRLLRGRSMTGAELQNALQNLRAHPPGFPAVSVHSANLAGSVKLLVLGSGGQRDRIDGAGADSPMTAAELAFISATLGGEGARTVPPLLAAGDAYYFAFHDFVPMLPVYRVIAGDAQHTRYYLDPISGALLQKYGANSRAYRWLHLGAHRWDFVAPRPLWDVLLLCLLAGVACVCATGAYMGVRRLLLRPVRRSE